jgi:hypothetical protein
MGFQHLARLDPYQMTAQPTIRSPAGNKMLEEYARKNRMGAPGDVFCRHFGILQKNGTICQTGEYMVGVHIDLLQRLDETVR